MKNFLDLVKRAPKAANARRVVEVGWVLNDPKAGVLYEAPRPITRRDAEPKHAKSASYCPAVLDFEARLYEVPCPFDLELGFQVNDKGQPVLANLAGDMSSIRNKHLSQVCVLMSRKEWRHPDRPMLQIITPYVFVSDEPVYMSQMPPFFHYRDPPLPGTLVGGRFPIDVWPRPMMWAFEWHDPKKPIKLKRGEPWFYARFEAQDPSRPVRVVEAELTPELQSFMSSISGVTNYVQRTFSLFSTAKERRPKKLLVKK